MASHRIALIPGDGIGKEVIEAGRQALERLAAIIDGLALEFETFPWGSDHYLATGRMMPEDALTRLRAFDAIYLFIRGPPTNRQRL